MHIKNQQNGAALIMSERIRQVRKEGYSPEHDDEYTNGQLAQAAMSYLIFRAEDDLEIDDLITATKSWWPWDFVHFKPTNPIRDLVKAGALIAAEIDRLQRLEE